MRAVKVGGDKPADPPSRRALPGRPGAGRDAPPAEKVRPAGAQGSAPSRGEGGGRRSDSRLRPRPGRPTRRRVESSGRTARTPPVYLLTVSRPVELSLQSSFQLSLTVLVRYRSRAGI